MTSPLYVSAEPCIASLVVLRREILRAVASMMERNGYLGTVEVDLPPRTFVRAVLDRKFCEYTQGPNGAFDIRLVPFGAGADVGMGTNRAEAVIACSTNADRVVLRIDDTVDPAIQEQWPPFMVLHNGR